LGHDGADELAKMDKVMAEALKAGANPTIRYVPSPEKSFGGKRWRNAIFRHKKARLAAG
jgi:hypothetical protein